MLSHKHGMETKSKSGHQEADLDTCFVVAGFRGAGKSTIIKTSHALNIHLFGDTYHEKFRSTGEKNLQGESDDFDTALQLGANFQGRHIRNLSKETSPPKTLLIQVDLHLLINKLGYSSAPKEYQRKIRQLTPIPTPKNNKCNPKVCDLMAKGFLQNPFFRRFRTILVNTIHTDCQANYKQYQERKNRGQDIPLKEPSESLRNAHELAYKSWQDNLGLLNPVETFLTHVSESGDLVSNEKCICTNWKSKAGFK